MKRPVDPGPPVPPPPPGGGDKIIDWAEFTPVSICMLFLVMMSLYHLSYDGYLGLSKETWGFLWAVSENGLAITTSLLISILGCGILRVFFRWVLVPYFVLRLLYHVSCYANIYMFSEATWERIWSIVLIIFILLALVYSIILIRK